MNKSVIFANAVVKMNEARLLNTDKIRRLLDANFADAVKMLYEYGYSGGVMPDGYDDADALIERERAALTDEFTELCPDENLAKVILDKYLYHDVKAAYKSRYAPRTDGAFYNANSAYAEAVKSRDYSALPQNLFDALTRLDADGANGGAPAPRDIDLAVDKAMYADILRAAAKSGNRRVLSGVRAEIDLVNVLTLFRARRINLPERERAQLFIDGGTLSAGDLDGLFGADAAQIREFFDGSAYRGAVDTILKEAEAGRGLVAFETEIDNFLLSLTEKEKENYLVTDPLVNYYLTKIAELKTVKTILICKKNGAPREEIDRRLRGIYL